MVNAMDETLKGLVNAIRQMQAENERLRAVIRDIERIAGGFNGYPEPADALLAIEQVAQRALFNGEST